MIKKLILIHTAIEILGGLALLFKPSILMLSEPMTVITASVIKLFGTLIFAFGLMSLLLYQKFEYSTWYKKVVLIIMGYHFLQSLQCYSMYNQGVMSSLGAFTVHMSLALFFMTTFMRERDLFPDQ